MFYILDDETSPANSQKMAIRAAMVDFTSHELDNISLNISTTNGSTLQVIKKQAGAESYDSVDLIYVLVTLEHVLSGELTEWIEAIQRSKDKHDVQEGSSALSVCVVIAEGELQSYANSKHIQPNLLEQIVSHAASNVTLYPVECHDAENKTSVEAVHAGLVDFVSMHFNTMNNMLASSGIIMIDAHDMHAFHQVSCIASTYTATAPSLHQFLENLPEQCRQLKLGLTHYTDHIKSETGLKQSFEPSVMVMTSFPSAFTLTELVKVQDTVMDALTYDDANIFYGATEHTESSQIMVSILLGY